MPTIGSRMTPFGAGISRIFAERQLLQLGEVVRHHQPLAGRGLAVHLARVACDRRALRRLPTLSTSIATTITGVFRNTMRASRTVCTRSTPGTAVSSGPSPRGNRNVRMTMFCDGMTNRSGLSAVSIQSMIE